MKKRILSILLALALCVGLLPAGVQAAVPTWDWAGYTPISSQAELAAITNDLDGKYYLTSDITLSGTWTPIGTSSAPFIGVLDGNGYRISGLNWNETIIAASQSWGLFGYNNGVIRNLSMTGADVTPTVKKDSASTPKNCSIGVLAGTNNGRIENCHILSGNTMRVYGESNLTVGGICGLNNGEIRHCSNAMTLDLYTAYVEYSNSNTNSICVGGIAGSQYGYTAVVEYCVNSGSIYTEGTPTGNGTGGNIGGIVGDNTFGVVSDCCNTAAIQSKQKESAVSVQQVGGIVGYTYGEGNGTDYGGVFRCENTGTHTVYGADIYAGGIVGCGYGAPVMQCHNGGKVNVYAREHPNYSCAYVGAIIGYGDYMRLQYCYNDVDAITANKDTVVFYAFDGGYIAGELYESSLEQCYNRRYNTKAVSSTIATSWRLGSLIGWAEDCTITDCTYLSKVSYPMLGYDNGGNTTAGKVESVNSDANSYYKSTRYFPNFDFDTVWEMSSSLYQPVFQEPIAHTHSLVKTAGTEGTCTTAGSTDYWYCADCDTYFRDSAGAYVISKADTVVYGGHVAGTAVKENEVAATCTAAGSYDEVVYCALCKTHVMSRTTKTTSQLDHKYGEPEFEWAEDYSTCTAVFACENGCGMGEEKSCRVTSKMTEGDCQNAGSIVYTAVCDTYSDSQTVSGTIGSHKAGTPVKENVTAATCNDDGSYDEVVYCSVCDEEMSREEKIQAATGHTGGVPVEENRVASTCETAGSYEAVVYCTACDEEISRETRTLPLEKHTPGEAVRENETAATCEADGSYDEVIYCAVCDAEISRDTMTQEKTGHTHGGTVRENERAATCEADGSYDEVVYCSVCDEEISREEKIQAATGHTGGVPVEEDRVESTCNSHGEYYIVTYCTVCEEQLSREWKGLEMKPHTPDAFEVGERVDSTCTTAGWYEQLTLCSVCRNLLPGTQIISLPLADHTPGEALRENEIAATCEADGSYESVIYCTVCDHEMSREEKIQAATGHTPGEIAEENTAASTCSAAGSYDEVTYCAACDEEIGRETKPLPLAEHTPGDWIVDRQPTTKRTGSQHQECAVCHATTKTQTIAKLTVPPFTDVGQSSYCFEAVAWAYHNNITKGLTATEFGPNAVCDRAQTVTFLWRAMGQPEPTQTSTGFTDVVPGAYYEKAVLWAVEEGITNGTTATTFSPNDRVTRGQVVTFLWRCADKPGVSGKNPFTDVRSSDFYYRAVLWAVEEGITNGVSANSFAPSDSCTRGQIVTFLYRYIN